MSVIKPPFSLRLNEVDFIKIKKIAAIENRSMNNMIETIIKQKIQQYEKKNGEIKITEEDLGLE